MKRILILVLLALLGTGLAGFVYYQAADSGETPARNTAQNGATDAAQPASNGSGSDDANDGGDDDAADSGQDDEDGPTAIPVSVEDVVQGTVSTYITATANLIAEDEVQVLAETEGRVTKLLVEEGDRVEAGQMLATLLRDEAEIVFNKAQLKADNARIAFGRTEKMIQEKLVAAEEFDRINMDHRIAEQELAEAKWALDKTEIRAPFRGRITRRNVTLGKHIRPGDEMFTVTSFDPLISRIYLPEGDVLDLDEGRDVRIRLKADDSVEFSGRIRQISPVVDTATGTVKVTVEAVRPPRSVRPGGFVIIDVVRETRANTTVVPRKAVVRELQSAHVFVVKDDVAEKRSVELGLEEEGLLEVLSGVEPGEQLIVAGQGGLKDGAAIRILADSTDARAAAETAADNRG